MKGVENAAARLFTGKTATAAVSRLKGTGFLLFVFLASPQWRKIVGVGRAFLFIA